MLTVVIVIHLMLVVAMIGVVLLQKSEGGGLVSSTSGFMTGRGTANVLTRTTALLAVGFFVTSLALSWLAGLGHKPASLINPGAPATQGAPRAGGAAEPKREAAFSTSCAAMRRRHRARRQAGRKCRSRNSRKTHGASDFGPDACDDQSQAAFDAA